MGAEGWDLLVHFVRLGIRPAVVNGSVRTAGAVRRLPDKDQPPIRYYVVSGGERGAELKGMLVSVRTAGPARAFAAGMPVTREALENSWERVHPENLRWPGTTQSVVPVIRREGPVHLGVVPVNLAVD